MRSCTNKNNKKYSKVRGVKNYNISFKEMELLLKKETQLNIPQIRWFKNQEDATIEIKNIYYNLKTNDNKRVPIYKNNIMVRTEPLIINYDEIVNDISKID